MVIGYYLHRSKHVNKSPELLSILGGTLYLRISLLSWRKDTSHHLLLKNIPPLLDERYSKDIRKVRKRQHQYPEFRHTQGEILKKPAKMDISIQGGR
jgi:hypothetical protein